MKRSNLVRMPRNRTYKRERQLEYLEAQRQIRVGKIQSFLKFCAVMGFFGFLVFILLYGTAQIHLLTGPIMKILGYN